MNPDYKYAMPANQSKEDDAMSDICYICLSDLHFGQDDSIMTNLVERNGRFYVNTSIASPVIKTFCHALRKLIQENNQTRKPTLILAGDILENALTTTNIASMVFWRFIEELMPKDMPGEEIPFDKIIYVPGNHDHHMWELGRETLYVNDQIRKKTPEDDLKKPWHDSRMFEKPDNPFPEAYYVKNLIERFAHLKGFEIQVAYPNLGLYNDKYERCVMVSHGHYVECLYHLMSELASMIFKKPRASTIGDIEAENFAWVDFFWSTMGRSGDIGPLVEQIYISLGEKSARDQIIQNFVSNLYDRLSKKYRFVKLLPFKKAILTWILKKIADWIIKRERTQADKLLSDDAKNGLKEYLNVPVYKQMSGELGKLSKTPREISFIFGHTHKPFQEQREFQSYDGSVNLYNTGGWVIESITISKIHGASAVLLDEDLNATSLRLYNEGKYDVRVRDAGEKSPLTETVEALVNNTSAEWKAFSEAVSSEVKRHQEFLKQRLRPGFDNPGRK